VVIQTPRLLLIFAFAVCGFCVASLNAASPDIAVETLVRGLDTPWAMDFAPDGRIFVNERPGRIRIVERGQLHAEPWMTLEVASGGEAGLLGLAVDPQFSKNHYLYVAYSYRAGAFTTRNRLARLREDAKTGKGVVDKVLLDDLAGASNHDGGRVKFGPDGKLYWTVGDAQTTRYAQNVKSLNGKILRLNADGSVPTDNPLPNSYVYSYGHRNPQGLAWQPGTERLYATEHGPSGFQGCCRDEVNFIEPGKNYGWPEIRGDQSKDGMVTPVIQSGTSETWAPTGAAFVTQGPWAGSLLFTGLRGQTLYRLALDPKDPRKVENFERLFSRQFGRLRDILEGPDKALYLLTSNRDGRGNPAPDDDRIIRFEVKR
jgi:glucose/arabinose dehydrogenase